MPAKWTAVVSPFDAAVVAAYFAAINATSWCPHVSSVWPTQRTPLWSAFQSAQRKTNWTTLYKSFNATHVSAIGTAN